MDADKALAEMRTRRILEEDDATAIYGETWDPCEKKMVTCQICAAAIPASDGPMTIHFLFHRILSMGAGDVRKRIRQLEGK